MTPTAIVARLDALAAERPAAVAVEDGGVALSYRSLVDKADALAGRLSAAGLLPGHHVGMICASDAERIVTALAILRAGGVYAPIDPTLPPDQVEALRAHAECALVVRRSGDGPLQLDPCRADATRSDGAYLRFTSGSTGAPKAILHSHDTALRLGEAFAGSVGVEAGDRVTLFNPFWHTLVWGSLLAGATLCLFDLRKTTAAGLARAIDDRRISVYSSFPTAFRQLVAAIGPERRLAGVRRISLSGEALQRDDVLAARRCFAPDCVLVNNYGASELGHISSHAIAPETPIDAAGIPVGHPAPGVALRLVDDDARRLPDGEAGEIAVRCAHLPEGYWRRPDLTARIFVPDPEADGERLYLTGDIGRFDSTGALQILGRKDRQVKIRGHRVLPEEVEAVLAAHPGVREVAVTAPAHWSGIARLSAAIVAAGAIAPTSAELRTFAASRLPDYMVPLEITAVPALPRAPSGKVDWSALSRAAAARPPDSPLPAGVTQAFELLVLRIWEELLSARPIGIDDDFFDLGGDSLSAAQVALRVEGLLDRAIPVTALHETPTIRGFAARCMRDAPLEPAVVALRGGAGRRPLFFLHPDLHAGAYCRTLANLLPADQPVIVLAPHGRAIDEAMPATIEAMGAERARLVRGLQPDGPIALAGFCNGALIAYETARHLAAAGIVVDSLIMIDPPSFTVAPRALRSLAGHLDTALAALGAPPGFVARKAGWLLHELHGLLDPTAGTWKARLRALAEATLVGPARRLRDRMRGAAPATASAPAWRLVFDRLNAVALGFLPRETPVALDVILTATGERRRYRAARWRRVARDVRIHRIAATHLGCLTRESAALAEPLQRCLARRAP
ncbi:MAG: AMP-binding protein [Alphaproteobacteria bacterium]|nr:AMP-binding protein [Alphaproteobacteria bacterium]